MNKHYDVFISYSRKDYVDENKNIISGNVVSVLKNLLKENQISYWFDEDGIYSGDTFAEKIASNIENASVLLFISSENSNASKWTSKEIAAASMWKKKIIPVRIDHSPYNKSVMLYIADLDFVDYTINPEKAKEVIIESIKNQIEKEKQAEQQAFEKHRQRQESLFRELTERIIRYNTEQKILLTSSMAIHKDIDHLEDAEKRNELKQMIISQNNSSTIDNDEIMALKERNNSLEEENERLKAELAIVTMKSEIYNTNETGVVNASGGMRNDFKTLCKASFGDWFIFSGTVNRSVYAIAHMVLFIMFLVSYVLLETDVSGMIIIGFFLMLSTYVSCLSFQVRRCRDVGKEWFWLLIPYYFVVLLFEKGKEKNN